MAPGTKAEVYLLSAPDRRFRARASQQVPLGPRLWRTTAAVAGRRRGRAALPRPRGPGAIRMGSGRGLRCGGPARAHTGQPRRPSAAGLAVTAVRVHRVPAAPHGHDQRCGLVAVRLRRRAAPAALAPDLRAAMAGVAPGARGQVSAAVPGRNTRPGCGTRRCRLRGDLRRTYGQGGSRDAARLVCGRTHRPRHLKDGPLSGPGAASRGSVRPGSGSPGAPAPGLFRWSGSPGRAARRVHRRPPARTGWPGRASRRARPAPGP